MKTKNKVSISVSHKKDGSDDFDRDLYNQLKKSIVTHIETLRKNGVELMVGDILSIKPSINDDDGYDTFFYEINHRQIGILQNGDIYIIYIVDSE